MIYSRIKVNKGKTVVQSWEHEVSSDIQCVDCSPESVLVSSGSCRNWRSSLSSQDSSQTWTFSSTGEVALRLVWMVSPKKPWGGSEFKLESLEEDHLKTGFSFTSQCFIWVFPMTEQFDIQRVKDEGDEEAFNNNFSIHKIWERQIEQYVQVHSGWDKL